MKILFAASEAWPLAKTGGLADVAYALPAALQAAGHEVRLVMPAYRGTIGQLSDVSHISDLSIRGQHFRILEGRLRDGSPPVWLIEHDPLYGREGNPYHDASGRAWDDNGWRFGCFSEACAQLALGSAGWTPDVVHANDWQTGLIAAWLRHMARRPRTIYTIHNLAYQGDFDASLLYYLGLPADLWSVEGAEAWGRFNFLKAGVNMSDQVTTVSPTYAREIQTAEFGCGLDTLLRAKSYKLTGILNGIDEQAWDPRTDPLLTRNFGMGDRVSGKMTNRRQLQADLRLQIDNRSLLIGLVGRLAYQKGSDVFLAALPYLLEYPVQFAILASGDPAQEHALREAAQRFPARVGVYVGYDEVLAHRIEAGADAFLMPSRFEPCGLNQMYSQRYGTVPLVRRTGGLADTVVDANHVTLADGSATGVCFDNTDIGGVHYAIRRAVELFQQKPLWRAMQKAGMKKDFSWQRAAEAYLQLYRPR